MSERLNVTANVSAIPQSDSIARFCSHCGHRASHKFCSACGKPLLCLASVGTDDATEIDSTPIETDRFDWINSTNIDRITNVPAVRQRIERAASSAKRGITSEQILSMCDSVMPLGIPLEKIASIAQPLTASLGIKTGKQQAEEIAAPIGETIVRVLCSLARHGQQVHGMEQADDGCTITATLPSDFFALEGKVVVTIRREAGLSLVEGATLIEGQWMDWGKSRRRLATLFGEIRAVAA